MNIYITSDASFQLWQYVRAVNTEIGGFGYAKFTDDGHIVWDDVFLVPQYASTGEVDTESTGGDAYAINKAAEDGVLGQDGFVWVSWHSHHTMQPFWSTTDDKRIKGLGQSGIDHLVSFVGCHDLKHRVRYDAFNVKHGGVTIPHVVMDDLALVNDPADDRFKAIYDDIDTHLLKKPQPTKVKAVTKQVTRQPLLPAPRKDDGPLGLSVSEALEARELMEEYEMTESEAVEMVTYGKLVVVGGELVELNDLVEAN